MKNNLYYSGDKDLYKIYRKKISTLSRQGKPLYYFGHFNENLKNMKNTWAGINLRHKYHSWYFKIVSNFTRLTACEITYKNFKISLVVFMPNILSVLRKTLSPDLICWQYVINILMIPPKFQVFLTSIFPLMVANWHPKYHLLLVILRSIYPVITAGLSFSIQWLPSKLKTKQFPFL